MSQKRIVLNPKYADKAQEILDATGLDSCSQMVSVLIACFGDELIKRMKGQTK